MEQFHLDQMFFVHKKKNFFKYSYLWPGGGASYNIESCTPCRGYLIFPQKDLGDHLQKEV
eukprot:319291-Ditylum_brightwellii.AAC.1